MANIVFLGAPGSGKGSQAARVKKNLDIPQISTGDMLRAAIKNNTDLGKKAAGYMEAGELVPDELVSAIVKDRLSKSDCDSGFILDGYPRTIPQAQVLEQILKEIVREIDYVVEIKVPEDIILPRITGRRSCPKCKRPYHVKFLKPKNENICDDCGVELAQRNDDTPKSVKVRLDSYHKMTKPLSLFYSEKGILHGVDGVGDMDEITQRIMQILKS
ncbi:MAG: adenylate kinase [Deltaproteobacteria bacterium]|jgi:adenylate kinase|nr:adenylate kinase [Deltaproteobacteria bacterium]